MLFNSYEFLLFFPVVCLIYYIVPKKYQYIWLLISSYYFYMNWNAKYALLLLFSTVVTWVCGLVLGNIQKKETALDVTPELVCKYKKSKKMAVAVNFILTLGVLFTFKYFNFTVDSLNVLFSKLQINTMTPRFDLVLPVGISFYTFQALSYSVDVYRGEVEVEKNFLKYALFVSFFPQLVAGPIERSKNLLKQVNETHSFSYSRMRDGLLLMMWGYFLKIVIADRAAIFVDTAYTDIETFGGVYLIVASVLFAIQIYCDFSGYSIIALGAAKVMGFELMENFKYPYLTTSVAAFWRNWHISLTSWFRDYLYIPLGGSKKGRWQKYKNILIVFLTSGLWHGASWHYIVWGGVNGIYQIVGDLMKPVKDKLCNVFRINKQSIGHKICCMLGTFILVDISWVFFRASGISHAVQIFKSMLTVHNLEVFFNEGLYTAGLSDKSFWLLIVAIIVLICSDVAKYRGVKICEIIIKQNVWMRWIIYTISVMFILIFGIWGPAFDSGNFIYFQF